MTENPSERSKGLLLTVLKGIGLAAAGLLAFVIVFFGVMYWKIGPKGLSPSEAAMFVTLEPGDKLLHAYTGVRWLDSQRYFVIEAAPEGFDARIAQLAEVKPNADGTPPRWQATVWSGPGKEVYSPGEKVPAWWDIAQLPHVQTVDIHPLPGGHSGALYVFSKATGRIYILDR